MAQLVSQWVMSSEHCIRESRINPQLTRPPIQNRNEYITAPEDAMQNDLVAGLQPSGGYENIVTAMNVFFLLFICIPDIKSARQNNH